EAADEFEESIRLKDDAAHIPDVKLQLGGALRKLGRQSEAILFAQQVAEQNLNKDLQDDAVWLVSQCAAELGDIDEARDAVRTLLRKWPRSSLAPEARLKLRDLVRRAAHGNEPPSTEGQ